MRRRLVHVNQLRLPLAISRVPSSSASVATIAPVQVAASRRRDDQRRLVQGHRRRPSSQYRCRPVRAVTAAVFRPSASTWPSRYLRSRRVARHARDFQCATDVCAARSAFRATEVEIVFRDVHRLAPSDGELHRSLAGYTQSRCFIHRRRSAPSAFADDRRLGRRPIHAERPGSAASRW